MIRLTDKTWRRWEKTSLVLMPFAVAATILVAGNVGADPTDRQVVTTASDGTVTRNDVHEDGTVSGTVTTPDGRTTTFGAPSADPEPTALPAPVTAKAKVTPKVTKAKPKVTDAETEGLDSAPCDPGFTSVDEGWCLPNTDPRLHPRTHLLPGNHPKGEWASVQKAYQTYWNECGPILIDVSGMDESPKYANWINGLKHKGWKGVPDDGIEAIYPPGC